jgi:hypothetical protein
MRWFRANKTCCGRLALFALALQFALSFAHIHPEDVFGSAKRGAVVVAAALPVADDVAGLRSDQATRDDADLCAICTTASLLNSSFIAAPPQLPPPAGLLGVDNSDRVAALLVAPHRAPFQSRAPPAA